MIGAAAATALAASTGAIVVAGRSMTGSSAADVIVLIAAVLTALGVITRWLHLPELLRNTRLFLKDWLGEPERDGFEAVPSFPKRMAKVERRTEVLQHDFSTEVTNRLTLIADDLSEIRRAAAENGESLHRLDYRVNGIDTRVTDHRRRNDETISALRAELERRSTRLDQKLDETHETLMAQLAAMSLDRAQNESMRASLTEIGLEVELPHPPPAVEGGGE